MLNVSFLIIAAFTGLFTQISVSKTENDTVRGRFYMDPPSYGFMKVNYPVNQILFNKKDTTYIYYPKSKQGFKLISNYSNSPDVSKGLIPVFKEEYLTKSGMVLVKKDYKNGELTKYFSPTDTKSPIKFIKIVYKKKLIKVVEIIDNKDRVIKRSVYEDYRRTDNKNIPMTIKNYTLIGKDSLSIMIHYDSLVFIKNIPNSIEKFEIPKGTKLKEVKW